MRNPSQTIYKNDSSFEVIPFEVLFRVGRRGEGGGEKGFYSSLLQRTHVYVCTYEYEVQEVKAPIGSVRKRNIIFFGSNFLSYTFHF